MKILKESDFTAGDSSAAVLDKVIIDKTVVDIEPSAPVKSAFLCPYSSIDLCPLQDTVLPVQADAEQLVSIRPCTHQH